MSDPTTEELIERVREYINGHKIVVDEPDGKFTYQIAPSARPALAALEALAAALERAEQEREDAIAHDRQPYPTADAYERVCKARDEWQARAQKAEAELSEDGRTVNILASFYENLVRDAKRAQKAEAENSRLREALREITATRWREIKDGVAYNQETPFQFAQRIHKIAADALIAAALAARAALSEEPRA